MDRHIDYYTIHSNIKEAVPVKEILVKLSKWTGMMNLSFLQIPEIFA